jgi:hypothetical protein
VAVKPLAVEEARLWMSLGLFINAVCSRMDSSASCSKRLDIFFVYWAHLLFSNIDFLLLSNLLVHRQTKSFISWSKLGASLSFLLKQGIQIINIATSAPKACTRTN